jgi:hypothetical protein
MNWKGSGRKRSWPNFKVLYRNSPGRTEKNTKTLNQDIRSPGRDLKPGPLEYEAGPRTRRPVSDELQRTHITIPNSYV